MLACSQHTAHLLQNQTTLVPNKANLDRLISDGGSLEQGCASNQYASSGSWSLQIVTKNAARCTWPQHSIPLAISSKQSSAPRSLHYQEFAQAIYRSIYHPSKQGSGRHLSFPPNIATSWLLLGVYASLGAGIYVYVLTSSEKKDKTLFGEMQPQCHHQNLVILKAPKNINHLHIAVRKMPNGRHYQYIYIYIYQYCKIR